MFIENLTRRERTFAILALTLSVIAITYGLIIEPIFLRWKTLGEEIRSKTALAAKDRLLLARYEGIEKEYGRHPQFLRTSKSEDIERAKVLDEIEKISKKSALSISSVTPRESKERGNYKEIFFEVTLEGTIKDFSRFLYDVEASSEFLRVKRFIIASRQAPAVKLKGTFIISRTLIAK